MNAEGSLREKLAKYGQDHLLKFWDRLQDKERECLVDQIENLDLELLDRLKNQSESSTDWDALSARASSPEAITQRELLEDRVTIQEQAVSLEKAREAGETALRQGKVAMILVAGGQGTRLGFDHPKGLYPIGPLSHRTLFQFHIDRLRAVMKRYRVSIPVIIMTSPATDQATREYFAQVDRHGLSEDELLIVSQGTMPSLDRCNGRILMSGIGELALSPDGHGGLVPALMKGGVMESLTSRGIETVFYGQVDNPLVPWCDPELIGFHQHAQSEMTTLVVRKRFAEEKVGNLVEVDGRLMIIEYSDLSNHAANRRLADGSLELWAGNIAVHLFSVPFLRDAGQRVEELPFHFAKKAIPFVDDEGIVHKPESPNGWKFERFIFDLLPMAKRAIAIEVDAAKTFAPVKNSPDAETDSPITCRKLMSELHRQWLVKAGAQVNDGVQIEIHPGWALDEREVKQKILPGTEISVDTYFVS